MARSTGTRTPESARQLRNAVGRSGRRSTVQLPISLVRSQTEAVVTPPLARLLRGGRGGEVRLKLYLCLCLMATQPPYDIRKPIPARAWAEALGLRDPGTGGARRVNDALHWLHQSEYIRMQSRRGHPPTIQLLDVDPLASGELYKGPSGSRWLTLPLSLWEHGWIVVLSGAATALLLVLLELQGGRRKPPSLETGRRDQYGLSGDTWTRATAELEAFGLLTVGRISQGEDFDFRRRRNTYWIDLDRLGSAPP